MMATNASTAGSTASTAAADSRGLSNLGGIFSSTTNEAGGRIWTSTGTISQNDFKTIVNSELMQGKDVNIISGVHGSPDGSLVIDRSMFLDDVKAFGQIPGVKVYNYSDLTPQQINTLLNGSDSTIGGFCNSGACLKK
jgi:filamentous hemagglutinin